MTQKNCLENIFIVDGVRTAIASASRGLKDLSPVRLGAVVIAEVLQRNKIPGGSVDQVILGNTVSAGLGQNLARLATIKAGLPVSVPAFTVNTVCGSGLQAVILAAQAIGCGQADMILAAAAESATFSPYLVPRNIRDPKKEDFIDSLITDGLWCHMTNQHMGALAEHIAEEFGISRLEQDTFAYESHQKACRAIAQKAFCDEIAAVKINDQENFSVDEKPRPTTTLEKLSKLPAAFKENGTVTAGNCCAPCDGAAACIVASGEFVKKHNLKPKARILGYASVAVEPKEVFTAAAYSVQETLKKSGLSIKDIDLYEICEAFAVQAILTKKKLGIPDGKVNIFGGDIAMGHPLGVAGLRIFVTLLHALSHEHKKKGVASVCLGGGGSVAVAVESLT